MSTLPKTQAPAYTDLAGLSKLRRGAGNNDPAAIRAVAEQFEALLTRTMLKSMRDASGPDPMFGSDQQQMYQGMADDQLSIQLAKGKGLGLADMLIRQLQKMGVKGADSAAGASPAGTGSKPAGAVTNIPGTKATSAYATTQGASASPASSATADAARASFVQDMWPHAEEAGQLLGVDPRHLIAQAALETNWGRNMPQDSGGRCSNNLFGIKASGDWNGSTVSNTTREFSGPLATNTAAQFRAYATPGQSFQDYVALLRNNPRYSTALNTGSDVQAFANGLQRGGYATDPNYASKIVAIAGSLKVAAATPPAAGAGRL